MGAEEIRAIRELEQRIEAVGSQRGGVLQEIQRTVVQLNGSFVQHIAADERSGNQLVRELDAIRTALEAMQQAMSAQSDSIATLRERSTHHDRLILAHDSQLKVAAGGSALATGLYALGKMVGWF